MTDWLIISAVAIYVIVLILGACAGLETLLRWYRRASKRQSLHGLTSGSKSAAPKSGRAA